ncbi:hypothetical protein QW060_24720 [Myroides ceti]|uniref:Uncharacterized protein n=1 Tax=Paenimyroides ceti TaxID=395087 RepID=A0ABT8D1B8_9FLAO|nr:hypothetical protein [Paenimyroides ceti]MDN3710101.1 hypothetical protein [Paenimyroides ceti]
MPELQPAHILFVVPEPEYIFSLACCTCIFTRSFMMPVVLLFQRHGFWQMFTLRLFLYNEPKS